MKRLSLLWILLIGLVLAAPAQAAIDVNNSFSPATIYPNQISTIQIRLLNSSLEPVTNVALTNSLPANVQLAATPNISSDCGGTFNIANGQITLSGGTIPASDGKNSGVCLLSADVTVSKKGTYVHTIKTGEVTGTGSTGAQSNTQDSKGTLVVLLQDLTIALSTASGDLYLHGYETDFIRYVFTNPNPVAVTNLTLSQSLYSDPNSIRFVDDGSGTNTCGGTVSLTKGTSTDVLNFNITGGSVPANGNCTVQVKVENRRDPKLPYNYYYSSNLINANKVTTNEGATNSNSATSVVISRSGLTVKKAFGSSSVNLYKDPTTTLTITFESDNVQAINNFNFTDVMPTSNAGDGTMTVKSITGNTCGGTTSHDATSLTITNGSLNASSATWSTPASCTISATVAYDKAGTYINTIPASDLNTYQYASATANIVVSDRLLEVNKTLTRSYMYQGDTNTVTLTFANYASDFPVTNIDLKDDLNTMCVGATCPNAGMRIWGGGIITNTCGGTVVAPADSTIFELRDAVLAAGQTCQVSFGIKASADTYPYGGNTYARTNTIPVGNITYDTPTQTGLTYPIAVTAKVTVYASMGISIKPFTPSVVAPMGQSRAGMTITRTMYDPNATSNIRFEYPLPAGHVIADDVDLINGCGGTITATPGTSTIKLSGGTLPAANGASYTGTATAYASSCTINFNIKAPALTPPNTSQTDSFSAPGQAHGAQTYFSATDDSQSAPYNVLENYSSYSAPLTRRATSVSVNKEFSPVSINGGGKSRVRIVFANTEPTSINLTKVTLTDSFSNTDMRLFTDINPSFTNASSQPNATGCRGGTFTGEPGGMSITLTNAEIDASSTCYFEFNITAHKGGNHINTIAAGDVVTFEGVTNPADVAATLTVGRQVNVGKGFYPNVISLGETSTLLLDFFNTNTQPNDEIGTSSALLDEMPSGIQIVGTPTTTCEGGTVTTGVNASGKHYLQLSGGKFPAEGACRISATVKTTAIGTFTNTIAANDLNTVSGATNPDSVSADLRVVTKPTITKYFSPAYIKPGATTNLTFTISNPNNSTTLPTGLTGITFTDNLVDMKIASPLSVSGTCTGYKSNAAVDGTNFTVSNLRLSPSGSCTISIPVTASKIGTLPNEASGVTSDQNATPSAVAKANLYTYQPTTLTKTFNPKQILAGGTSVLTLTITNPNATTVNLMGTTSLTDLFPSSPGQMVLAATPNIQKSAGCSSNISIMDPSNTRTAAAGDTGIVIKNGYLGVSSTCTISMNVTASVDGQYVNTTSSLDTAANLASAATATLNVGAPKISGVVFEDVNYGGGAGRDKTTASGVGVDNVTVELYKADGSFVASTTTKTVNSQAGTYTFDNLTAGQYYVRVVNKSVKSTRPNATTDLIGVQTFRTNGVTAVTNEVGGHAPALEDGIANDTANPQTLNVTGYKLADGTIVQSLQAVTVSGVDINGVDFGFNFDTIVNTNDSGQGSFRQFQLNSNLLGNTGLDQEDAPAGRNAVVKPAGVETSIFEIPNTDARYNAGVWKLNPSTGITDFTDVVKISGYTQPGSSYNTAAFPSALNTKLAIQLDGTSTTTNINGIRFDSGSQGSSVEGLAIVNWEGSAIVVKNSADNIAIQGNFIGVLPDGVTAGRNMHGVEAYTSNLTIGGSQAAARNMVSGNNTQDARSNFGLRLFDKGGHHIEGNFIGVDRTGASALRNRYAGIWFENSSNNEVRNNVIAGNGDLVDTNQDMNGITIGVGSNQIGIYGNYIGTDNTGTKAIPNAQQGIWIFGNDITIGSSNDADRNIISGNKANGLDGTHESSRSTNIAIENNYIGVDITGKKALANQGNGIAFLYDNNITIKNNIISANLGSGVDTGGGSNMLIVGNKVGVDQSGLVALGNGKQGLYLLTGINCTIGGASLAERNIISGNTSDGIVINGLGNDVAIADLKIINNYIGVNSAGDTAIANGGYGISRWNSSGGALIQDNIISGNGVGGIYTLASGNTTDQSQMMGNLIGVDVTGKTIIANGGHGIMLVNSINQRIGGSGIARNIISGNAASGLGISGSGHLLSTPDFEIENNYIGVNSGGDAALANQDRGINIADSSAVYAIKNNVISGNGLDGIEFYNVGHADVKSLITGNVIGLDSSGTNTVYNNRHGIYLWGSSHNITVGGSQTADRNIISANTGDGINLYSWVNGIHVENNTIGLNQTGSADLGNKGSSLTLNYNVSNVTVLNNIMAGNKNHGIFMLDHVHDIAVKGNAIGLNSSGQAFPNQMDGINVKDYISNVNIGGVNSGEANIIAYNKRAGVATENGNTNIQILHNSLYKNDGLAIDLQNNTVTLNDANDADTGDNALLNFPLFKAIIEGGNLVVKGCAPTGASIDLYEADVSPTSSSGAMAADNQFSKTQDYGEGERFLTTFVEGSGEDSVATPVNCSTLTDTDNNSAAGMSPFQWTIPTPSNIVIGDKLTATATVTGTGTSEFSAVTTADVLPSDYGDAPASYGVVNHLIVGQEKLGAKLTAETSSVQDADDSSDDGIVLGSLMQNDPSLATAVLSGSWKGYLNAWIDWNGDGDFADAGEQVALNLQDNGLGYDGVANDGQIQFLISPPSNAVLTPTYARFRYSTTKDLAANSGTAPDGEVEDYKITIKPYVEPVAVPVGACAGPNLIANGDFSLGTANWVESHDTSSASGAATIGLLGVNSTLTSSPGYVNAGGVFRSYVDNDGNVGGVVPVNLKNTTTLNLVSGQTYNFNFDAQEIFNGASNGAKITWVLLNSSTGAIAQTIPGSAAELTKSTDNPNIPNIKTTWQSFNTTFTAEVPTGTYNLAMTFDNYVKNKGQTMDMYVDRVHLSPIYDCDWSDAPASYGKVQHSLVANLHLGTAITDKEADAQPSTGADGDDTNGTDDEDGVSSFPLLLGGATSYSIPAANLSATGTGTIHAWIDFNKDGMFGASEYTSTTVNNGVISAGLNWTNINVTATGSTYVRLRYTSTTLADDVVVTTVDERSTQIGNLTGEVEDYSIPITPTNKLSGRVFEDMNYGGGAGRDFTTSGGKGVNSATVELYKADGTYVGKTTTANDGTKDGAYTFSQLLDGNYYVRVVSDTVNSTRTGTNGSELGIQTFRTNGTTAVTNEVGGHNPSLADGVANAGTETLDTTNYKLSGGAIVQTLQPITLAGANLSGVDFGFNFDTIVNTNDSGQGSLRQFMKNSNLLGNTGLDQAANSLFDPQAGHETSIFMIPSTDPNMSSGVATITINSSLDSISAADTHFNGYTQSGAKPGAIGARDLKIRIIPNGIYYLFDLASTANNTVIAGFNLDGFNKDSAHSPITSLNGASNLQIKGNYLGTLINGAAGLGVSYGMNIVDTANVKVGVNLDNGAASSNDGMTDDQEGNVIGKTSVAITITKQGNHVIAGNWIGVDASGLTKLANAMYGIYLINATSAQIGGTSPLQRNIISGSQVGLNITGIVSTPEKSTNVKVLGNYVGVGKDGLTVVNNINAGILVPDADQVQIGDGTAAGANVVSGSSYFGIVLVGSHPTNTVSTHVVIKGNLIGVGADGVTARGNGRSGISIAGQSTDHEISYNTIANNGGDGIEILLSNSIYKGTGTPINSKVSHNTFFKNGELAIDLSGDNVTLNDSNDADIGSNTIINFPVFKTMAINNGQLMLQGCAPTGSSIELYEADVSATSASKAVAGTNKFGKKQDYGEGERYLTTLVEGVGEDTVSTPVNCATLTDTDGNSAVGMSPFQWTISTPIDVLLGDKLTATATNSSNTSEFSNITTIVASRVLSGRVFEDMSYGGGAGRDFTTAGGKGVNGATVELYKADGTYVGNTTTANDGTKDGAYTFSQLLDGNYYVRVVSDTVNSTRTGTNGSELGIQTFRTNGTTAVTNEVGGHNSSLADGVANAGTETLDTTNYKLSGGAIVQTLQPITLAGADLSGVDFGFNFDTIVNTNDSGQGSFRQFILNSNLLGNSGLAQTLASALSSDYVSGDEVSIFMIPKAQLNGTGGNANTAFIQFASALPLISDSATKIDGRTQTANIEDSNTGQVGIGGTVGTDKLALSKVNRPEVTLDMQELAQLHFAAGQGAVRGLTVYDCVVNDYNGCIESDNGANGTFVEHNIIGAYADGSRPSDDDLADAQGMSMFGQSTVRNNYFAYNRRYHALIGGGLEGSVDLPDSVENSLVENNEFYNLIQSIYYADAIAIYGHDVTFQGNLIHNMESGGTGSSASGGKGIEIWYNTDNTLIKNNTITGMRASAIIAGNDSTGIKIERNQLHDNGNSAVLIHGTSTALMSQNSFWNNGLGIDLVQSNDIGFGDSVSLNDAYDADTGGNDLVNFPMFTAANIAGTNLTVRGCAPAGATLELYEADVSPTSSSGAAQGVNMFGKTQDYGEGERYLTSLQEGIGEDAITPPIDCATLTDADGNSAVGMNPFQWTIPTPAGLSANDVITATTTLSASGASGGTSDVVITGTVSWTSEFSANIRITSGHNLRGRVFEDVNYGGGVGRDFTTAAGKGVNGATVELYKADGAYVGKTTTANDGTQDGVYTFNQVLDGSYYVRVVNDTVNSTRVGSDGTELGVQTFRTDGTTAVTNEVGGHKPSIADGAANTGAETLNTTNYKLSGGAAVQSLQAITMAGADLSGAEFGFNFDTIVNTNDSGQGSLRQFILNSNLLGNTGLSQVGQTAGKEVSIFMIADGNEHAGLAAGLVNGINGTGGNTGAAVISLSSNLTITASDTTLDATTQTQNVGDLNSGLIGTGSTVGVDKLALDKFARPEIVLNAEFIPINTNAIIVQSDNVLLKGFAIYGYRSAALLNGAEKSTIVIDSTVSEAGSATVNQLFIGAMADGSNPHMPPSTISNGLAIVGAATVSNNYVAFNADGVEFLNASGVKVVFSNNELFDNGPKDNNSSNTSGIYADQIEISAGSQITIRGNLIRNSSKPNYTDAQGQGVQISSSGYILIDNNTFNDNNAWSVGGLANDALIRKNIITGTKKTGLGYGSGIRIKGLRNRITQNSIYQNTHLGIDLGDDIAVTANNGSVDSSLANNGMDYPILTSALLIGNNLSVTGFVGSAAGQSAFANATLEIFKAEDDGNNQGAVILGDGQSVAHGEGKTYLGTITAAANGSFNNTLTVTGLALNDSITLTATDANGNTSEFSPATLVTNGHTLTGRVFEDMNYGGGAGRDFTTAAGKGVNGVTVELYKADGTYVTKTTTANDGTQDGVYTFNQVLDGSYYVRVVNDTVNSTRVGSDGTELGVQTFRTDGTTAVTNEVGGHKPSIADGAANTGTETLDSTNYKLSGGAAVQSLQAITMAGADLSGVEFGFNFDTIVNTNDSGQGSLRQFVLNANLLDNTNLDQVANSLFDPAAEVETSIFMIPTAQLANSGANQGAAVITITSPISSIADNTAIDARTQTANIGNTNAGQLGTGGKVGVDGLTLDKIERPEVVVKASGGVAFNFDGNNGVLRGIAGYGASLASANYMILNKTSVVDGNLIGALADGSAPDNSEQNDYISLRINAASTITNNLFAYSPYGILTTSSTAAEIRNNEFAHLGSAYGNNRQDGDGISIQSPATVVGNLFHDMQGAYDASGGSYLEVLGLTTASNNTFKGAQRSAVRLLTNSMNSVISKNIITGSIAGSGVEAIANNASVASGTITQNSIYANHTLGIDLGSNGVTLNDANDSDTGVNNLLNFPLFKEVLNVNGQLVIKGCAPAGATLELYEADVSATSASGVTVGSNKLNKTQDYGEGERYLISLVEGVGEDTVTTPVDCATLTDSDANSAVGMSPFQWTLTMPTEFVVGDKLTATATVSGSGTSEFSPLSVLYLYQDRGDALASYGDPTHTITDGLYLGMQLPDRDDTTLYSAGADGDGADEDGVSTLATLTTVTQTYSTNVMVTNQLGKEAWSVGLTSIAMAHLITMKRQA